MSALLRRAGPADAEAISRLFRETRRACLPYLAELHTAGEELAFFRDRVLSVHEVWVAETEAIEGFCVFRVGWLDHLYVKPWRHGRGLGTALLAKAMEKQSRLRLWVFQRNQAAIRFYLARGFREIERTDGRANEEGEPDALFEWVRSR